MDIPLVSILRPDGRALSTLRGRLAAIRLMHLGAGLVSPHAAPEVTEVLRGIANARRDVPSARKRPVLDADVCRMVDALDIRTLAGLRDRAVLLLGFAGALRRSEIVALHPGQRMLKARKSVVADQVDALATSEDDGQQAIRDTTSAVDSPASM